MSQTVRLSLSSISYLMKKFALLLTASLKGAVSSSGGICNGFQALVKSGLLPYGDFEEVGETSPTLFYNDANQHVAKMVKPVSLILTPWLAGVKIGDIHAIPVSHGEGKFVVTAEEFAELRDNGQIWSQYVDFDGKPLWILIQSKTVRSTLLKGLRARTVKSLVRWDTRNAMKTGSFKTSQVTKIKAYLKVQ